MGRRAPKHKEEPRLAFRKGKTVGSAQALMCLPVAPTCFSLEQQYRRLENGAWHMERNMQAVLCCMRHGQSLQQPSPHRHLGKLYPDVLRTRCSALGPSIIRRVSLQGSFRTR